MSYPIRNILVAMDMSETALNALDTAVALAKKHNATIYLLNVLETMADESGRPSDHLSNSQDVLSALLGSVQHMLHARPRLIQQEGHVVEQILKCAATTASDLVVMGTHGASGYRQGFLGSNTYLVMKHALTPVLTVPPRKKYTSFRAACFPIRPVSGALSLFELAAPLLSEHAKLQVLGLTYRRTEQGTQVLERIVDEIKDSLESACVDAETGWSGAQTISEEVLQYAAEHSPDLIVLTSVLDVTVKKGFMGPHAQRIANCSRVPVLSLKTSNVPAFSKHI